MYFNVSNMDFSRAMDEVFLRLLLIFLRVIQFLISIIVISLSATLVSDFNGAGITNSHTLYATLAISCVCAAYSAVSLGPVVFEGGLFFTTLTVFDVLLMGAFIGLTVKWEHDATSTCSAFGDKYAGLYAFRHGHQTDCRIVKALYAFTITSLYVPRCALSIILTAS